MHLATTATLEINYIIIVYYDIVVNVKETVVNNYTKYPV